MRASLRHPLVVVNPNLGGCVPRVGDPRPEVEVITSNQAENFFSQLKRCLDGTHHRVSRTHLHRYPSEFDFRYSTKDVTYTERMAKLVGQYHGKRLKNVRVTA